MSKALVLKRTNMDRHVGITLPNRRHVSAHITGPEPDKGGVLSVWWEVVSEVGGLHVIRRAATPRTHLYDPACETWYMAIRTMMERAKNAYWADGAQEETMDLSAEDGDKSVGPFCRALDSLREEELSLLRSPLWRSDRTWSQHLGYLRRICEYLDRKIAGKPVDGKELDIDLVKSVRDELIADIVGSKKTKSSQTAARTADKELRAVDYCMVVLCELINEQYGCIVLPPVSLLRVCMPGAVATDYEQIKWIPIRVLTRLIDLCFKLIPTGLVMGVALMLCLGLRTSEACAVLIGDLEQTGNGVIYKVRTQGAKRNKRLKTPSAYRDPYFGKLLSDLIDALKSYLRSLGYSDDEIMVMPAVSMPGCPTQAADSTSQSPADTR